MSCYIQRYRAGKAAIMLVCEIDTSLLETNGESIFYLLVSARLPGIERRFQM